MKSSWDVQKLKKRAERGDNDAQVELEKHKEATRVASRQKYVEEKAKRKAGDQKAIDAWNDKLAKRKVSNAKRKKSLTNTTPTAQSPAILTPVSATPSSTSTRVSKQPGTCTNA